MNFTIEVNGKIIQARKGETILESLAKSGITVPTLCHMPGLYPTGSCRMCVVEVEGKPNLITACSFPVEDGLKIRTHSPRVVNARKTNVELLLGNHPDDCLYCERNGNCELQTFAAELGVRERRFRGSKSKAKTDPSGAALVREPSKCILCGRCVRTCDEVVGAMTLGFIGRGNKTIVGPSFNKQINLSSCINCGQCIMACPTGALHEKRHSPDLLTALHNPEEHVVLQLSPTVQISMAENFGLKTGKDSIGVLVSASRRAGFDKVFDTSFAADLYITELAAELEQRIRSNINLPLFSSDCPAWVKFAEQKYPEILPQLSSCKSPQQMTGSLIRSFYAPGFVVKSSQIFSVSAMPCTAKKFESQREQMTQKGITEVDTVMTTRELSQFIKLNGIGENLNENDLPDAPFHLRSSASRLLSVSGGLSEALIRTLHYRLTGTEIKQLKISELRQTKEIREVRLAMGEYNIGFAVADSMKAAGKLVGEVLKGRSDLHFIEVMACQGGCINGGGQPISDDQQVVRQRIKTIYEMDEKEPIKVAHKNPAVIAIYREFLGEPLGKKAIELLHTTYTKRDVAY